MKFQLFIYGEIMKFKSPAKINVFLKVLGKRPDGFHELVSLMQAVDLCDYLDIQFSEATTDKLSCSRKDLLCDSSNLVLKALDLYKKKFNISQCFSIHLEKNIPIQAGLGGGSSNAATTLFGVNHLLGAPARLVDLIELSKDLGSDITFFLSHGTALCKGRGDLIENRPPLNIDEPIYLFKPKDVHLSTPHVFKHFSQNFLKVNQDHDRVVSNGEWGENDLLEAAESLEPKVKSLYQQLRESFKQVGLSGTGPSFFARGKVEELNTNCVESYQVRCIQRKENAWF